MMLWLIGSILMFGFYVEVDKIQKLSSAIMTFFLCFGMWPLLLGVELGKAVVFFKEQNK